MIKMKANTVDKDYYHHDIDISTEIYGTSFDLCYEFQVLCCRFLEHCYNNNFFKDNGQVENFWKDFANNVYKGFYISNEERENED